MLYILDNDPSRLQEMRRLLFRLKLFSEGMTYKEAEQIPRGKADALILLHPRQADEPFCALLSSALSGVPVVCFGQTDAPLPFSCDLTLAGDERPIEILYALLRLLLERSDKRPDELQVGAVSDHLLEPSPRVFGTPIHLSATQRMILRYLMTVHPDGAPLKEVKHFCLRPGSECTDGNIPAHIGQINRIFFPALKARCIENVGGRYMLLGNSYIAQ